MLRTKKAKGKLDENSSRKQRKKKKRRRGLHPTVSAKLIKGRIQDFISTSNLPAPGRRESNLRDP